MRLDYQVNQIKGTHFTNYSNVDPYISNFYLYVMELRQQYNQAEINFKIKLNYV